jgi:hypothetical protein
MKKYIIFVLLFVLIIENVIGQDWNEEQKIYAKIGLSDKQVKEILAINLEMVAIIDPADVKMRLIRAQIEKLLLPVDVDMTNIEKLLREAMEEDLKVRLAKINREVRIKKLIGDKKWIEYNYYFKQKPVNADDKQKQNKDDTR